MQLKIWLITLRRLKMEALLTVKSMKTDEYACDWRENVTTATMDVFGQKTTSFGSENFEAWCCYWIVRGRDKEERVPRREHKSRKKIQRTAPGIFYQQLAVSYRRRTGFVRTISDSSLFILDSWRKKHIDYSMETDRFKNADMSKL